KGCELEYYYTYKAPSLFFGRELLQGGYPTIKAEIELISPSRLLFEVKTYNGMNKPADTIMNKTRVISLHQENIPAAEEEKNSLYSRNLKRVEYKLSYNTSGSSSERLFTWDELAKNVHNVYTAC